MEKPTDANDAQGEPMESDSEALTDRSMAELISSARRAHELIEAVDLDKVVAHDKEEVQKLKAIEDALVELEQGKVVDHVDGVDEVVPTITEDQRRKAELIQLITEAGWSDNISRVLTVTKGKSVMQPLDLIPHHEGLPPFDVCLAPQIASGLGSFGMFISANAVFAAALGEPPEKHHWRIVSSGPHNSPGELLSLIEQYGKRVFE